MLLRTVRVEFVASVRRSFPCKSVEARAEVKMPSLQFIKLVSGLFVSVHVEQMDLAWKSISFGFSQIAFCTQRRLSKSGV